MGQRVGLEMGLVKEDKPADAEISPDSCALVLMPEPLRDRVATMDVKVSQPSDREGGMSKGKVPDPRSRSP